MQFDNKLINILEYNIKYQLQMRRMWSNVCTFDNVKSA